MVINNIFTLASKFIRIVNNQTGRSQRLTYRTIWNGKLDLVLFPANLFILKRLSALNKLVFVLCVTYDQNKLIHERLN